MTSFAVGEPFAVQTGKNEKAIAALVALDVCMVVCMIIGCLLDVKKVLIFDKVKNESNLPNADGAAAVEQSSAAMEMSANIAPGGQVPNVSVIDRTVKTPAKENIEEESKDEKVDVEEIKVDVEQTPSKEMTDKKMKAESPNKPAVAVEENPEVPDVYAKPIGFKQLYNNAFRYYHRIAAMFFSADRKSLRPVKVINTFT